MTEGYFVQQPFGVSAVEPNWTVQLKAASELEEAKSIIGEPMVQQLKQLAKRSSSDPEVVAKLLHNTLAKLDHDYQIAACVVWGDIVSTQK